MNSCSRKDRISARTNRAVPSQLVSPITIMMFQIDGEDGDNRQDQEESRERQHDVDEARYDRVDGQEPERPHAQAHRPVVPGETAHDDPDDHREAYGDEPTESDTKAPSTSARRRRAPARRSQGVHAEPRPARGGHRLAVWPREGPLEPVRQAPLGVQHRPRPLRQGDADQGDQEEAEDDPQAQHCRAAFRRKVRQTRRPGDSPRVLGAHRRSWIHQHVEDVGQEGADDGEERCNEVQRDHDRVVPRQDGLVAEPPIPGHAKIVSKITLPRSAPGSGARAS